MTIKQAAFIAAAVAALTACTHGHVSSVPISVEGVGDVYLYQGRANFGHQLEAADRMMTDHCRQINGGRPVLVHERRRDLGPVLVGTGENVTMVGNQNQELYFRCVTD